ncbi:hypothetical protein Tco_1525828 [Tanacetum coccineum]
MSSMSEDIQCAGSDTRPPMLDRTDFESWQQCIRLYCLGKDNGKNIMKSINEGPFHMGTISYVIARGTGGAIQQGPVRARVLNDLSAEEKERYKADIRATNILLQGIPKDIYSLINHYTDARIHLVRNLKMILGKVFSELTKKTDDKESNFDQLYAYLKQHLVHANENRTMMERFLQPTNDPLALELLQQKTMIESFSNHTLPSSHIRTNLIYLNKQSTLETVRLMQGVKFVVQDVRGRYNANNQGKPFQRNNARGNVVAGNVGGQNRGGINPGQAKPIKPCSWEKISHLKIQSNDEVVPHMTQILLLEEALEFNSFLKDQESRTSDLKEKYNVIEDYETFASLYGDEEVCEPYNAKAMSHALIAQLRTHKSLVFTSDSVKPKVLAPGMYAIDVKPIPHPLKNNRSAHLNYISHLKESVENNSEIVEKLE